MVIEDNNSPIRVHTKNLAPLFCDSFDTNVGCWYWFDTIFGVNLGSPTNLYSNRIQPDIMKQKK